MLLYLDSSDRNVISTGYYHQQLLTCLISACLETPDTGGGLRACLAQCNRAWRENADERIQDSRGIDWQWQRERADKRVMLRGAIAKVLANLPGVQAEIKFDFESRSHLLSRLSRTRWSLSGGGST